MAPKKILLCTDFSDNSEPARKLAVEFARAFGANLLIVHVIDSSSFPNYVDWIGEEFRQALSRNQKLAGSRLESQAKKCEPLRGGVRTFCKIGSPAKEIVALANDRSVDLIVVGTHGRTGVKNLVMGSIARSVLRTAHRPVLIVGDVGNKGESSERPHELPAPIPLRRP